MIVLDLYQALFDMLLVLCPCYVVLFLKRLRVNEIGDLVVPL